MSTKALSQSDASFAVVFRRPCSKKKEKTTIKYIVLFKNRKVLKCIVCPESLCMRLALICHQDFLNIPKQSGHWIPSDHCIQQLTLVETTQNLNWVENIYHPHLLLGKNELQLFLLISVLSGHLQMPSMTL